ncbi:hypothetical protein AWM68_19050 [Fictibacillus phosphorivorans]|uniref:DUF4362 domain-containing protein n=1 Tax=Fictibacillus phosphorivorans TaxID=1221500 RepID=A0A163RTM2_9BACL|nr:hypothetical protein [Fictibacillus phosphorivorans]KZE67562.1 hypothetical protein AWM68_19050 [Fictibacillus phosphorivorans]
MKKVWATIGLLALLIGCSEKEMDNEPKFTVKEAIKNNVVIQNLSDKEHEIMSGETKAEHLVPMFAFLDDVKANKESTLQITVFPKSGEPTTSELHFISEDKTVFTNNNKTFAMPTGEIECMSIRDSNRNFTVDGCNGEYSSVFVFPFGSREYNLAKVEYKKKSKN